ncbi:Exonuclease mut-7 homolog [Seminavis robusta]|uniref:Exonuclease mut-7 homolog n=1 Tax=Seminavis robusta TaxID=568900 RepID=A0A9N8EH69_9STRA|nr:Exonuclease mut-7 homolog [Seminavis robusta]|eukprot:Sro944_g222870.1 Exonuclease mut-7 homolog (629) ;mRNA; f:3704-5590
MSSMKSGSAGDVDNHHQFKNTVPSLPKKSKISQQRLETILRCLSLPIDAQKEWKPADILSCLQSFLSARGTIQSSPGVYNTEPTIHSQIAATVLDVRSEFHQIIVSSPLRKNWRAESRKALEAATQALLLGSTSSGRLATLLVGHSLALEPCKDPSGNRAIASAMVAILFKGNNTESLGIVSHGLFAAVFREATESIKFQSNDWRILARLAKAEQVNCLHDDQMAGKVVTILGQTLGLNESDQVVVSKSDASSSLALAAQLQPWQLLEPQRLVKIAIHHDLWHAAEQICASAPDHPSAVDALLEGAMQTQRYRQADQFATTFYEQGGKTRYLEARYLHACSTITKVIQKGAIPLIKQVDRVDKAAQKVVQSTTTTTTYDPSTVGTEIRDYALQQLVGTGNLDAAQRFAETFDLEYVLDQEAILQAQQARRATYLQFEDLLPGSPPDLLSSPKALLAAVQELEEDDKVFGFDTEWNQEHGGVDVCQIASLKRVILIDIPTLSSTPEGADALEKTIGRLFASFPAITMVGFSCKQDIKKLRTSGSWFGRSQPVKNVQDLQTLAASSDHKMSRLGLSRVCERYLGKPLDKSEQCSQWNERPLSLRQRTYAALDAWTVRAIYDKVKDTTVAS